MSSHNRTTTSRRAFLGALALGATGSTAGCIQRMQALMARDSPSQVRLDIKTVPADEDPAATQIARHLETNLSEVGIDTDTVLLREDELRRDVLINRNFDIFVTQFPGYRDPDFLRPLLHSRFSNESGWQNPFDFTSLEIDQLLETQRGQSGLTRSATLSELQQEIAREQPFVTVAAPNDIHAVRGDRFSNWGSFPLDSPGSFLGLEREQGEHETLRLVATDDRITRSLNPIAVEYRNRGIVTELLYDSLLQEVDGELEAWLAADVISERRSGKATLTVELRPDLRWHNGSEMTAEDVAFTYRFLQDTTLGERESPVPASRFRSRSSLVGSVEILDDRTVELGCPDTSRTVARQALTVPILPQTEWEDATDGAEIGGVSAANHVTEALIRSNTPPVGSGVMQFVDSSTGDELVLERFEDHFLHSVDDGVSERIRSGLPFDRLEIEVVRSDEAAVFLVESGDADATISTLSPGTVPSIGRAENVQLQVNQPKSFYLVGFNTQIQPLGNPHVRRAIARLLNKKHIVEEVFDGFGDPAATPLVRSEWSTTTLEFDGSDPEVPFFGSNGQLDTATARDAFREAGFEYDEGGLLLQR